MNGRKSRILILGGGFAGVYAAQALEKLTRRRDDIEVALVNAENYFVFQPLLAEIVSGNIGLLDTISPLRRLLPKTQLFIRPIEAIDPVARQVRLGPGFWPQALNLDYDHLVVALGTVTDFRGMPGLHEHALAFKDLQDAVRLRNHLIRVLEEASIETDPRRRAELLTFVVAGGGFSGTEVVAEINDFVRRFAKREAALSEEDVRVILVHSGERVLQRELTEGLSRYATDILAKRGVELRLGARLKTASPSAAVLSNDERIETRTLVSTVPSSPNPVLDQLDAPKQRGRLEADACFRVRNHDNLWALGDCALVPQASGDGPCPPTAQHAVRQGKLLAHNIVAVIDGKPTKKYDFTALGKMGSLGHHSAVAELFNRIRVSGFPAWLLWRSVYWLKLPGFDRKLRLGLSWLLDLIIPPEMVQLNLAHGDAVTQFHFEAGEIIFRKGDLGDSLYMILSGRVEVLADREPDSPVVATLGGGECFGEMALLRERSRTATIRCAEPTDVLALRQRDFGLLVANLPAMRERLEKVMRERVADPDQSSKSEPQSD